MKALGMDGGPDVEFTPEAVYRWLKQAIRDEADFTGERRAVRIETYNEVLSALFGDADYRARLGRLFREEA